MLLLIREGEDATTKGECEAVVAKLCGITLGENFSFAVSQSTDEMSDWDNASMTEADSEEDSSDGANAAEDRTPTEVVSTVESM